MNLKQEAMKFFEMVCQNSNDYISGIRELFYKSLGIETKDEKLIEYIKESIENFDFNTIENEFLTNLQKIINEELAKIEISLKNNEELDYENIKNSLLEKFKAQKNINITLEDNLKELATQMVNRFLMMGVSKDDLILHFTRKNEQLCNLIKENNQKILDSLVFLTPHFVDGIKENVNVRNNNSQQTNEKINQVDEPQNINNSSQVIDANIVKQATIDLIQKQIDDIHNQWKDFIRLDDVLEQNERINGTSKIAKYYRALLKIKEKLETNNIVIENMTQEQANVFYDKLLLEHFPELDSTLQLLERYKKGVVDVRNKISKITSEIHLKVSQSNDINELLNYKREIEALLKKYDKNEQLELELTNIINKIVNLTGPEINNPKNPESPNPTDDLDDRRKGPDSPTPFNNGAEIGNTNESMIQLIESGSYFSVLQGITNNNINKYRNFINNGFRVIFNRWKAVAEQAKTNEERMESYRQLKEIYEQFKNYLQSEKDTLNMLETMISEMDKYFIQQQRKQQSQIIEDGVRYNTSREQTSSIRRM